MELIDKFIGTDECPIQVNEPELAVSTKYRKGRRMAVDALDDDNDEDEAVRIDAWGVSDGNDEEDEEGNVEYVRFGTDDANWK